MDGEFTENKKLELAGNIINKIKAEPSNMKHYASLYAVCKDLDDSPDKWRKTFLLKQYCAEQMRKGGINYEDANAVFRATLLLEARGLQFGL